jgi:hypothetical protein
MLNVYFFVTKFIILLKTYRALNKNVKVNFDWLQDISKVLRMIIVFILMKVVLATMLNDIFFHLV